MGSLCAIIIGMGALFCVTGIIFKVVGKSPYTAQTQGVVVDMCLNAFSYNNGGSGKVRMGVSTGSSSAGTRCPVFRYSVDDVVYQRAGSVAYNYGTVKKMLNKQRTVYYDPKHPERISLTKSTMISIVGSAFIPIGGFLLLLGVILTIVL